MSANPTNGPAGPAQTIVIPDKYARLGARTGFAPTEPEDLKLIVESMPGRGKTQFIMSAPNQLVLDFDCACCDALRQHSAFVEIKTWDDYASVKDALIADADSGTRPFRRIAFDTTDRFMSLLDHHLVGPINDSRADRKKPPLNSILEFGEKGAGYSKLTLALLRELADFERVGYPYTLSCHMRVRRETVGDTVIEFRRCVMPPTTMETLVGFVDMKVRLYRRRTAETTTAKVSRAVPDGKGGKRVVQVDKVTTTKGYKHWLEVLPPDDVAERDDDTKRRIPELSGEVELPLLDGWQALADAYHAAAEAARAKTQ